MKIRGRVLIHTWLPVLLAVLAVFLALPSLWTGWQLDDITHRYYLLGYPDIQGKEHSPLDLFAFLDGDPERTRAMMDLGLLPWWTVEKLRLSFWRPLSSLTHWLDYRLWPQSGALMHLQSLLWFGLLIAVASLVYRRFLGLTWVAGLAALLYAIDDAHGLPASWLAGRNGLLGALFGMLVLYFHDRWRSDNWRAGSFLAVLSLILGLLSGESALGVISYLVAYTLFLERSSVRQRLMTLMPYAAVTCVWLAMYTLRGYGTWGSGFYVDPLSEPLAFARTVIERGPILLLDQWAFPPSSMYLFYPPGVVSVVWTWALVFIAFLVIMLLPLLRTDQTARFWSVGMILSLPLICATMPHSRLLFFVGLGGMGLLAQWIEGYREHADWLPVRRSWRIIAKVFFVFMMVIHLIVAPMLLPLNSVSAAFAQPYLQEPAAHAPLGPTITEQDLVIVNPPIVFYAHYFGAVRIMNNQSVPRRLHILAPGVTPLHISRPDGRTLVIRPEGGFLAFPFDNVFRGPQYPMHPGERVELTNMAVVVRELTGDGRPAEVAFQFPVPLEDASLKWLMWKEDGYTSFTPPAVGSAITVPAVPI
jgi:hypothetical protein